MKRVHHEAHKSVPRNHGELSPVTMRNERTVHADAYVREEVGHVGISDGIVRVTGQVYAEIVSVGGQSEAVVKEIKVVSEVRVSS